MRIVFELENEISVCQVIMNNPTEANKQKMERWLTQMYDVYGPRAEVPSESIQQPAPEAAQEQPQQPEPIPETLDADKEPMDKAHDVPAPLKEAVEEAFEAPAPAPEPTTDRRVVMVELARKMAAIGKRAMIFTVLENVAGVKVIMDTPDDKLEEVIKGFEKELGA